MTNFSSIAVSLRRGLGRHLLPVLLAAAPFAAQAQTGGVGIGTTTPAASAVLDLSSTTKGLLPPRLSTAQRDAIASPAAGLTVYNTTTGKLNTWNGTRWEASLSATEQPIGTPGTTTFTYTGGPQTYTVPADVYRVAVDAAGGGGGTGGGGGGAGASGGAGARVQATLSVTPGEVLTLYVGGRGADFGTGAGGYNGGGSNGVGSSGTGGFTVGGGGGGASDVRRSATAPSTALAERLLVAAGGGGGGRDNSNSGFAAGTGGGGGAPNGLDGSGSSAVGLGAPHRGGGCLGGTLGLGGGGSGGGGGGGGGGGAGGYYGGGGGRFGGGAGGGSSWVTPTGSQGVAMTASYQAGNGVIVVTTIVVYASPALDGSNFVNVPGDNLGNHTATQNLNLGTNKLVGATAVNLGSNLNLGTNQLVGATAVNLGSPLNLGTNQLVGNGGSQGLSVGSTGNVGIGTATPGQKLEVAGGIRFTGAGSALTFPDGTTQATAVTAINAILNQTTPQAGAGFNIDGNGTIGGSSTIVGNSTIGGSSTVTGSSSIGGSLGVGISAPTQKLEVAGQVFSSTGGFRFPDNTVQTTAATAIATASNGLTRTGNDLALGGTLTQATTIAQGGNAFGLTGGSVGIGTATPAPSAALEVSSTTKGLLPPRLTQAQRDAIAGPATGLTLYNTTTGNLNTWNGTSWDAALSASEQPYQNPAQTFTYTAPGGVQTYTVPPGVTSVQVDARGASGGSETSSGGPPNLGGAGARVQATLSVVPGQVLQVRVGGAGTYTANSNGYGVGGGYNGGGAVSTYGGAGGGATDVRSSGGTLADRLLVAGGGGGCGFTYYGSQGGAGGAPNGGTGTTNGGSGIGGTQTAGGARGGALGTGGIPPTTGGGGGGGGYYGGGAGGDLVANSGYYGGGGGGSSWVTPTGSTGVAMVAGANAGNGSLTITPGTVYAAPALDGSNFVNVAGPWTEAGTNVYRAGGNVGVGTSAPVAKLTVQPASNAEVGLRVSNGVADGPAVSGNIVLQTLTGGESGFSFLGFNGSNASGETRYGTSKNRWRLGTDQRSTSDELFIDTYNGTSGTSALRITTAGNVGLGTAPSAKLHVAGGVKIDGANTLEFGAGVAGKEVNAGKIGYGTFSGGSSLDIIGAGTGGNRVVRVYAESGLGVNGPVNAQAFNQNSDARFKTNVRPIGSALAAVLALRGVRYDWNGLGIRHGGRAGAPQVGLIAQELEKVYPELVSTDAQGFKAVNYAQLTPVLIEALKEQQAQIEALKQQNAALQTRATTAEAKATATLETFEARLRLLEAAGSTQAQR